LREILEKDITKEKAEEYMQ